MQLIITVDTEADNQWAVEAPQTTNNLDVMPRFQRLCDQFRFPPTYLCTHEVVTSPSFRGTIAAYASDGRAEVGAHLHPWSTPPFDAVWDGIGAARPYPSELPPDLVARKLDTLTSVITDRVGVRPASYRVGRWGLSAVQIGLLVTFGYRVDCSVTPGMSWQGDVGLREGGPDFSDAPAAPYVLSSDDPARPGDSGLLEVPVTILHTSRLMHRSRVLRQSYRQHRRSLPWRAADRFFRVAPQWLRPYPHMTAERLIAVADTAHRLGRPVLEMMFHSSELLPGGSPYNLTPASVDRLFDRLARLFEHLASRGVGGVMLTGFARERGMGR